MAGITAAKRLKEISGGQFNVVVLEGSHRLGGRVYTSDGLSDGPVELGAEYIHRPQNAVPLWNEVLQYKLKTSVLPKVSGGYMYNQAFNGGRGALRSLVMAGLSWNPFVDGLNWSPLHAAALTSNVSNFEGQDMAAAQWISENYKNQLGREFAEMVLCGHVPALSQIASMRGFAADRYIEQMVEPDDFIIHKGNSFLLRQMSQGLDFRYNQKVESIDYSNQGVTVRIHGGQSLSAKTAICSFSVGMLKSGEVEFLPRLPKIKQQALDLIEIGDITKLVISFNKKFWPKDMSMLHRSDKKRRANRTYFNTFYQDKDMPAVLSAYINGEDAIGIRNKSDEEVLRDICLDLGEMFPNERRPFLDLVTKNLDGTYKIFRKQWADDPFSKGGLSYLRIADKSNPVDVAMARSILADPLLTPPLYWAGEATSTDTQPSSMHGAHLSGLRAAKQVQSHIIHKKPYPLEQSSRDYQNWLEKTALMSWSPFDE